MSDKSPIIGSWRHQAPEFDGNHQARSSPTVRRCAECGHLIVRDISSDPVDDYINDEHSTACLHRDISSDPVDKCHERSPLSNAGHSGCNLPSGHDGMHHSTNGVGTIDWPRDISSDPVDGVRAAIDRAEAEKNDPDFYRKRGLPEPGSDDEKAMMVEGERYISSVIGSGPLTQEQKNHDAALWLRSLSESGAAYIEREAVDAFIEKELSQLLTEAMTTISREHYIWPVDVPEIAAKVAELRK